MAHLSSRSGFGPQGFALGEIVSAVLVCILFAMAVTFTGYIAYCVIERNSHGLFNDPVWHEPPDSWNL